MYEYSRIFKNSTVLLLFCAAGACLAKQPSAGASVWWAPDLQLASISDIDRALAEPVVSNGKQASVTLQGGDSQQQKTVQTCDQYLDAIDQKMAPTNEQGADTPFIDRCYALRYLKSVQEARQNFIGSGWEPDVLNRVPPFVIFAEPSVSGKAAQARERHESWKQFDPGMTVISRTDQNVLIQDSTDRWNLKTVARGDFNQDGLEDEVVIACNSRRTGSGGFCLPVVLTASAPDQVMTVISSPSQPYSIVASSSTR